MDRGCPWSRKSEEINAMTVDVNNDVWVATTFEVSMTFGSVVANAGINEVPMGIAKISQSGTWQSAYANTGSGQPLATDFTMDDQNNLLMSGFLHRQYKPWKSTN